MALSDLYSNFQILLRWIHVLAGIIWLGHLYFFNFVNVPFQSELDDAAKKIVNPKLMPRALWWFRWGAMVTFAAGLTLFTMIYMFTPGQGFGPSSLFSNPQSGLTNRAIWVLFGMLLGAVMWFNVWFIIWPAQKSLLQGKVPPEYIPAVRKRALLTSRINAYLSGPMLFGMLAPSHYGAINPVTAFVAITLGVLAIWAAIGTSSKVGTEIN